MKLNVASQYLTEMGKPSQVCPKCGHSPIHKTHTYNAKATSDADKWRCKNAPLPGYPLAGGSQAPTPASQPTTPTAGAQAPVAPTPTRAPATPAAVTPPSAVTPPTATAVPRVVAHTPAATRTATAAPATSDLKSRIKDWLEKYAKIGEDKATINEDNSVEINDDVDLTGILFKKVPMKINKVTGDYTAAGGSISTLENSPDVVTGDLTMIHLDIKSFVGGPSEVGGDCIYTGNDQVTSIEGLPSKVGGRIDISGCKKITSLKGIHKIVKQMDGEFDASTAGVKEAVLGLMAIRGITSVNLPDNKVAAIINKHLSSDDRDINACQEELIDAGFTAWAKI